MLGLARGCGIAALGVLVASITPATPPGVQRDGPYTMSAAFRQTNVRAAWDRTGGDCSGVIIAVIGNGVDIDHPNLKQNILSNPGTSVGGKNTSPDSEADDAHGWNFESNTDDPRPDRGHKSGVEWHETYVAGIIGAAGNNSQGAAGICRKARILPIRKVFADDSNPDAARQAAAAINYAVSVQRRESAREGHYVPMVINGSWVMDLGAARASPVLGQAIKAAADAGIAMVFAAGNYRADNDDPRTAVFPASWSASNPNVISVGAVDENDHLSSLSNRGNSVLITAPALGIVSTVPGGGYALDVAGRKGFTSWAAPQVTAAIAMYWTLHPTAPFSAVRSALLSSADHIPGLPVRDGNRLNVGRMMSGS